MKVIPVYLLINAKELISLGKREFYTFSKGIVNRGVVSIFLNSQIAINELTKEVTSYHSKNYLQFVIRVELKEKMLNYAIDVEDNLKQIRIPEKYLKEFNDSITGKVKPIHVAIGDKYDKGKVEVLKNWIDLEYGIYESRLKTFLRTKSRKILPFNYFDRDYKDEEIETPKISFSELKEKATLINTIDEAVDFLINDCLHSKEIEDIKDQTALTQIDSFQNHFGINMYLRNLFFYGYDNTDLKKSIKSYSSDNIVVKSSYGELGEGLLADVLWRRLHGMELKDSIHLEKMQQIDKKIDDVYSEYFIRKGFEKWKLTEEQLDIFINDQEELRKKNSIDELVTRRQLLSYCINEENIEKYLTLNVKKYDNDYEYFDIEYEKETITGQLKEEEFPVYKLLKKEYFEIYTVYNRLEDFAYSKK